MKTITIIYPNTATIDDSTPNFPPVKINDFDNNLYEKIAPTTIFTICVASILFFTNSPEVHNNTVETTTGNRIAHIIQRI